MCIKYWQRENDTSSLEGLVSLINQSPQHEACQFIEDLLVFLRIERTVYSFLLSLNPDYTEIAFVVLVLPGHRSCLGPLKNA